MYMGFHIHAACYTLFYSCWRPRFSENIMQCIFQFTIFGCFFIHFGSSKWCEKSVSFFSLRYLIEVQWFRSNIRVSPRWLHLHCKAAKNQNKIEINFPDCRSNATVRRAWHPRQTVENIVIALSLPRAALSRSLALFYVWLLSIVEPLVNFLSLTCIKAFRKIVWLRRSKVLVLPSAAANGRNRK